MVPHSVSLDYDISYDAIVTYQCDVGYKLEDGRPACSRTCGYDGHWRGATPVCSGMAIHHQEYVHAQCE